MSIRQIDLANKWGLDRSTIANLVRKGMPLDSEEAAMRWRHANKRGQKLGGANVPMPVPLKDVVVDAAASTRSDNDAEEKYSTEAMYRRCQSVELAAYSAIGRSLQPGSPTADQLKMNMAAHSQAVSAKLRVERQIKDEAIATRTLIHYDDAVKQFMDVLLPLRTLIDGMPRVCGPRCNPSDPQLSTKILEEWVKNSFLKILEHGETSVLNRKESRPDAGQQSRS